MKREDLIKKIARRLMLGIDGMREWGPRQQWRVAGSRQLCLMFRSCFPRRRTASTSVGPTPHRPTAFVFSTFYIFLFFWSIIPYKTHTHTHTHMVDNWHRQHDFENHHFWWAPPRLGLLYLIHSCMLVLKKVF